jgi:hypothetical protein
MWVNPYQEIIMSKSLINEVVAASPNRRKFLKTLGVATAGVTALSLNGVLPAKAATATEVEVLQFALNLEYLEADFYTHSVLGKYINDVGIGVTGSANGTNSPAGSFTHGGSVVNFTTGQQKEIAAQIGSDERAHVTLLREALGSDVIARPLIDLNALGLSTGGIFNFVRQARIFEDIGVTAYAGAAGLLSTPAIITYAARILATEAEHVASIRMQILSMQTSTAALDGADLIPPPSGSTSQVLSTYVGNGLVATRTPGEVLYLAFGGANLLRGGFYPSGVNGAITMSSGPATSANLS